MTMRFALESNRQVIVHISETGRGLGCGCVCPVCQEPVIAKKGAEREHHFAHASNQADCDANYETMLHKYAKRVILEAQGLIVPDLHGSSGGRWLAFTRVEVEEWISDIRPDLTGYAEDGARTLIEIAYSAFADAAKCAKLAVLKLPALEIDLHDFTPEDFDPAAVQQAVCHALERKHWLYSPEMPKPAMTIKIKGMFVTLKRLLSGDLVIRFAFNPEVIAIIKPIAQQHHGRWEPRYRNWIVPYRYADAAEQQVCRHQDAPDDERGEQGRLRTVTGLGVPQKYATKATQGISVN